MVNTLRGLTSVRPSSIELMRSYAAGEVEIFRRVRIPNSLPYLFSALKVATVLAMIGAIVGEYFLSSQEALGFQIRNSAALFQFELAWAAIVVASVLGILFYAAVALVERLTMSWHPSCAGRTDRASTCQEGNERRKGQRMKRLGSGSCSQGSLAALALVVAGCGGDDDEASGRPAAATTAGGGRRSSTRSRCS